MADPAAPAARQRGPGLAAITEEVVGCRRCPRLVAWRELVAVEKRASFSAERYWGRPVPGFGDPDATLLVV
ncbi:MAG: uracil-DNA glycosylase, partial [Acidimicrobiales bacterium]